MIVQRLRLGATFLPWLLVPLAWAAVEYARTYLFTGFPWNLIATAIDRLHAAHPDRPLRRPVLRRRADRRSRRRSRRGGSRSGRAGIARVFVGRRARHPAAGVVGNGARGVEAQSRVRTAPSRSTAALLQPNISQEMRWDEANVIAIYQQMIDMTDEAARHGAKVVIWPESTVPLSYTRDRLLSARRSRSSPRATTSTSSSARSPPIPTRPNRLWNSAFLVSSGKTIGHYDKIRLVPFGEYVPLRRVLFFAEKLVRAVGEFEFGTNEPPLAGKLALRPGHLLRDRLSADHAHAGPQRRRRARDHHQRRLVRRHVRAARSISGRRACAPSKATAICCAPATTGISAFVDPDRPRARVDPDGPRRHHLREVPAADNASRRTCGSAIGLRGWRAAWY